MRVIVRFGRVLRMVVDVLAVIARMLVAMCARRRRMAGEFVARMLVRMVVCVLVWMRVGMAVFVAMHDIAVPVFVRMFMDVRMRVFVGVGMVVRGGGHRRCSSSMES